MPAGYYSQTDWRLRVIVTPLDIDYISRISGPESDNPAPRSTGKPHLTDIIRSLAADIGKSKGKGDISEDDLNHYAMGGWLWEHIWDRAFAQAMSADERSIISPGEVECDGVVGTPDRLRVEDDGSITVIDMKCRWASASKLDQLETHFWQEITQCASYCHMVGARAAELHVFFVAGNWRPPTPIAKGVRMEFTDRELDDYWGSIIGQARRKGWL